MRRLVAVLLCFMLLSVSAFATSRNNSNLMEAFYTLCDQGLSEVAAAAMCGNISGESNGSPTCVEGGSGGRGIGVFQQSNDANRQELENYCAGSEHDGHEKVTLSPGNAPKSYVVCNRVDCQVKASLSGIAPTMNARKWSKNYNSQVESLPLLHQAAVDGLIPEHIDVANSWEGFKSQTNLKAAVIQFLCDYETSGETRCFWVGNDGYRDSEDAQQKFIDCFAIRYGAAKEVYEAGAGVKIEDRPVIRHQEVVVAEPVEVIGDEQVCTAVAEMSDADAKPEEQEIVEFEEIPEEGPIQTVFATSIQSSAPKFQSTVPSLETNVEMSVEDDSSTWTFVFLCILAVFCVLYAASYKFKVSVAIYYIMRGVVVRVWYACKRLNRRLRATN